MTWPRYSGRRYRLLVEQECRTACHRRSEWTVPAPAWMMIRGRKTGGQGANWQAAGCAHGCRWKGGEPSMAPTQGTMIGVGGLKLYYRKWEPSHPVGSLVIVHGTNEHIGRYQHVVDYFAAKGMAVYALDQRGYGRSEGVRCYVDHFSDYLSDLQRFLTLCHLRAPVMVGHSLGGLIAYRYAVTYPQGLSGLILSSPFFALRYPVGLLRRFVAPVLSRAAPRLQLKFSIPGKLLTRNPAVAEAYEADPLVGKTITPRWFMECQRAARDSLKGSGSLTVPVLFLQAGEDYLVNPDAARIVYESVPHDRKRFRLYLTKYHEIFNDPGYKEVFAYIWQWLNEQGLVQT